MGPKSKASNGGKGRGRTNSGNPGRSSKRSDSPAAKSGSEVPRPRILEHATAAGKTSNFPAFKTELIDYMGTKYGNHALFLETNRHWEPPAVKEPAEPFTADNDPHGTRQKLLQRAYTHQFDLEQAYYQAWPKISSEIWSLLSKDSRDAIKAYKDPAQLLRADSDSDSDFEDDDDGSSEEGAALVAPADVTMPLSYATFQATKDPLVLWKLIQATHRGSPTGSATDDALAAQARYHSISQGATESTAEFRERFDQAVEALVSAGLRKPSEYLLAAQYIRALHPSRYSDLKAQLAQQENVGLSTRPKTLHAAHNLAMRTKFTVHAATETGGTQPGIFFAATGAPTSNRKARHKAGGGGSGGRGGGGGSKQQQAPKEAPATKSGDHAAGEGKKRHGCDICGDPDHRHYLCPHLPEIRKKYMGKRAGQVNATVKAGHVHDSDDDQFDPDLLVLAAVGTPIATATVHNAGALFRDAAVLHTVAGINPNAVFADSGANTPLFGNADLLTDIRDAPEPIIIQGVGGGMTVKQVGDFGAFGTVYYHPRAPVNVLAVSKIAKQHDVRFVSDARGSRFVVKLRNGGEVSFDEHNGLYSRQFPVGRVQVQTVAERAAKYTKRQVTSAEEARDFIKNLGYASNADAVKMLNSGAALNAPVTKQDVYRAQDIFGPDVASLKGKTKLAKAKPVKIEYVPPPPERDQTMHADIMFVNGEPYLINVCHPLGLTLCRYLTARTAGVLAEACKALLSELRSRGYRGAVLLSDGEGGIAKIIPALQAEGVIFNPAGPQQHVPVVESKIRVIKERVRAILSSLPYKLPAMLLRWCVTYVVTRINMLPSSLRVDQTSPRELFLGRKVDAKKDLCLAFGDYVQAKMVNIVSNSMAPRVEGAIALNSLGNVQGSWLFYRLSTGRICTHDQWIKLPVPDSVIAHMNALADPARKGAAGVDPVFMRGSVIIDAPPRALEQVPFEEPPRVDAELKPAVVGEDVPTTTEPHPALADAAEPAAAPAAATLPSPSEESSAGPGEPTTTAADQDPRAAHEPPAPEAPREVLPAPEQFLTDQIPAAQPAGVVGPETEEVQEHDAVQEEPTAVTPPAPPDARRYPARSNRTNWREKRFAFHITVKRAVETFGDKAAEAVRAELQQMLDNKVWTPLDPATLSPAEFRSTIYSSMFLKEKFLPDGSFEKLKARLVANGNQQDKTLYATSSVSSPAAALSSVLMGAGIAAAEGRHVVTMDIVGAYLKIDMTGREVRVRLPAFASKILCEMRPDYAPFLLRDGTLIVRLDKALYGCIESGRLLFNHIKTTLVKLGFKQNPYDQCVFNKGPMERQCTVVVYVDDLFISCRSKSILQATVDAITGVYRTVKLTEGLVHHYLGMTMDFSKRGDVKITMGGFVEELLDKFGVPGTARSPAAANLFEQPVIDAALGKADREEFHSIVAKLLYLAKRVRPDILLAISYLATRVNAPTESDRIKLTRVLKYLNGTRELGLVLSFARGMVLETFVDVAFGVHADYKSHTGAGTSLGKGVFDAKSTKQRLVTKSSTEAELVGASDYASDILHKREFLIAQGYKMGPAVLYQDNKSTIAMLNNGRTSSDRTRHINIRYFFVKDRIDSGEVRVEYKPTEDMIADILTKPLQGALFLKLREKLLNWPV